LFTKSFQLFPEWQDFHRDWPDFHDRELFNRVNDVAGTDFSTVIYAIHPHEFLTLSEEINNCSHIEFYYVDLNLAQYQPWVDQAQEKLKFRYRPDWNGEYSTFAHLVSAHNMKPISLTAMLDSDDQFLCEYLGLIDSMQLTADSQSALKLFRDWKTVREPPASSIGLSTIPPGMRKNVKSTSNHMFTLVSRPPHDKFTFELFQHLTSLAPDSADAYYLWTCPPNKLQQFFKNQTFTKSLVIIAIKDLLDMWLEFDHWQDTQQAGVKLIADCARRHANIKFIIVTSLENLHKELHEPNVSIVNWGGDITNQSVEYPGVVPVLDKNFDSPRTFISLNRHAREHRLVLLSYLFGQSYDQYGHISFLSQPPDPTAEFLDRLSWCFDPRHDIAREKILTGYRQVYNKDLIIDDYEIYGSLDAEYTNNNVGNFNTKLRRKYQDSFVEIVTESSFSAPAFLITEKTLNSIYGCNFPIILSGVGAVAHLREVGFDMFDDVINHDYDTIENPFDRIIAAVEHNRRILLDADHAKQCWSTHRDRFVANIAVAKNMYAWYHARACAQFVRALDT
jgi:hypothetical protein